MAMKLGLRGFSVVTHAATKVPQVKDPNRVCTRLSSWTQWLGSGGNNKGGLHFQRDPGGIQAKRASENRKLTEPAPGKPPCGSGRHLGQQSEFQGQELLGCSAANHSKGALKCS
jgi:hypothetical protein